MQCFCQKNPLNAFILFLLLCLSQQAAAQANFSPDRLIVKLKIGQTMPTSHLIKKVNSLFDRVYVVYSSDIAALEKTLTHSPQVDYVEKDFASAKLSLPKPMAIPANLANTMTVSSIFNDPRAPNQWHLQNADSDWKGISLEKAIVNFPQQGAEIIVAVVDSGVDFEHEDLREHIWSNPNEIADNGIDDDQNGYVDDVHGINTLERDVNGHASGNVMDADGHGTHVAGLIGAVQNNAIGVAGIARNVKIMPIRTVPNSGDEKDVDVVESFIYAARQGAKIINCSFGKRVNEGGSAVSEAITFIGEKYGTLVVVAAGNDSKELNDSYKSYPASYSNENMVVVAAATFQGKLAAFSNWGARDVDLASPGRMILSTYPHNQYEFLEGTSMAAPIVSAIAAELWSQQPTRSLGDIKNILLSTVTPSSDFAQSVLSGGRVDLFGALQTQNEARFAARFATDESILLKLPHKF